MIRKKEAAPCSLNRAATASFKLEQNYFLTQFSLQTPKLPKNVFVSFIELK